MLLIYWLTVVAAVVKFDIQLNRGHSLARRDTAEMVLESYGSWFSTTLQIGDGQNVTVQVDTASSDLWVFGTGGECHGPRELLPNDLQSEVSSQQEVCEIMGSYSPSKSRSFHNLSAPFNVYYAGGDVISGWYANDSVTMGSVTVPHQIFGVATNSTSPFGVIGLGFDSGMEAANGSRVDYHSFPQSLQEHGLIERRVFGLYLDREDATSGSIMFGGVDRAKYEGEFHYLNLQATTDDKPNAFNVRLDGLGLNGENITSQPYIFLLDTGAGAFYGPQHFFDAVTQSLGAVEESNQHWVPCPADNSTTFEFHFGTFKVEVPLIDLVGSPWRGRCPLTGFDVLDVDYIVGGVPFLRQVYTLFDIDNHQVGLAKVVHSSDEDIEVISSQSSPAGTSISQSSTVPTGVSEPSHAAISYSTGTARVNTRSESKKAGAAVSQAGLGIFALLLLL
ncbi:secreted aspartic protease 10 [Diutina catenulata]